jgi:hypothetical protein
MPDKYLLINKIKKSSVSEIWIGLKEYEGKVSCDLREHFRPDEGSEWHPTKKGVSIPPSQMADAVDAAAALAKQTTVGEVAELPKGPSVKICFGVREFNKRIYAEVRLYYADKTSWKPGKGITLNLALVPQLAEAVRVAEDQLDEFEKC